MKLVAFIPIKLKNDRLPGKNLRSLGGKPLIQYQQEELLKLRSEFTSINVYCSDPQIKQYLLEGVNYIQRPSYLDLSTTKGNTIYAEFINTVNADFYLLDHVTAPFVTAESISRMIEAIKTGCYDSAFAAYSIKKFLWENGKPLNFDISDLPRTQDLEPVYVDQCGPYIFSRELFRQHHRRIGFHPFIQSLNFKEAIDIDTLEDFDLASKYV